MKVRAPDVVIVGGGTIGLAIAWRAQQRGLRTLTLDAGEPGAWQVAAGMLAPVTEADFGEDALLRLGLEGARRFEDFCAELAAASDRDPGLHRSGTLVVARDADEAATLDRLHALQSSLGLDAERLLASAARRAEPGLAPSVRLALDVPGDHSIEPRALAAALAEAVERAGGVIRARTRVQSLVTEDGGAPVAGVRLGDGEEIRAEAVVVAAGARSAELAGVPVRPVKGQILRLRDPDGPGLVTRTIRTPTAYLVPRPDGRYVLGATVEERGWSRAPTAGGAFELIRDIAEVVPGVFELEVEELSAGLRPGSPDNLPLIGASARPGLHLATGHYRNGILLTGVTAELVVAGLCGEALPDWAAPADPRRFTAAPTPPTPTAVAS